MIDQQCLAEITSNRNTGVEYEIALFYNLCRAGKLDTTALDAAISSRPDKSRSKIKKIRNQTPTSKILKELAARSLTLTDVSFETQNDEVGPADVVMTTRDADGKEVKIGLSVKYANTCSMNTTGRNFLSNNQIQDLSSKLPEYVKKYIAEMNKKYGGIANWFHKRKKSENTDAYINLIRDAVIANWANITNKQDLFSALFHADSPIEFWVVKYKKKGYSLNVKPASIDIKRVTDIKLEKYLKSNLSFTLDGVRLGKMQVKFNNGILEVSGKREPDIIEQGKELSYGSPFNSWNFSVEV